MTRIQALWKDWVASEHVHASENRFLLEFRDILYRMTQSIHGV